ncbi:hypothetical protein ACWKWC_02385 [Geodermatophilus nigrescens]
MTVGPELSSLAGRTAEAQRRAIAAIRESATMAGLIALTYDEIASTADGAARPDASGPRRERASVARRRAAEERRAAWGMWARAAALESAAD